jgi:hypothetical protein
MMEMRTYAEFWMKNQKGRDYLGELVVDGA